MELPKPSLLMLIHTKSQVAWGDDGVPQAHRKSGGQAINERELKIPTAVREMKVGVPQRILLFRVAPSSDEILRDGGRVKFGCLIFAVHGGDF